MRIALLYNLKPSDAKAHGDLYAEFDTPKTLEALAGAMQGLGHQVDLIPFGPELVPTFASLPGDLIFSIAENLGGVAREAWVPTLCDITQRPYAFSGVLANSLTLHKALTKRVLTGAGIPAPTGQVVTSENEALDPALAGQFPLFVKPLHEGSGKGITEQSLVRDADALRVQVTWLLSTYGQPVLVEPYLAGREFTVGVLGNDDPRIYVMELDFQRLPEGHQFYSHYVKDVVPEAPIFTAPPLMPPHRLQELENIALAIKQEFGLLDAFRFDVRCDAAGQPYVLEINPLPGLTPGYSDLPRMVELYGETYESLIAQILEAAARRWGL